MELYATVTSERASKGQGGNKFLYIKVQGGEPGVATLLDVELIPDGKGRAGVGVVAGDIDLMRALTAAFNPYIEEVLKTRKGKKQKDERNWMCPTCKVNCKDKIGFIEHLEVESPDC